MMGEYNNMNNRRRRFFYKALSYFSFMPLILKPKRFTVLAYHDVPDKKKFEAQILYLKKNYNLISFEDLKNSVENSVPLPKRPLLITFDDGDVSVFDNGLPVLKKHNVPSVLFIITELIDSENNFWWRVVEKNFELKGKTFQEARKMVTHLKKLSNRERKNYMSQLENVKTRQLSLEELFKMKKAGMEIANHTYSHPMMNRCQEEEVRQELEMARKKFDGWGLSEGYSVFAYPNGNWDQKSEKVLKEEGIEYAFLFDHKINKENIDPLRISRVMVDANVDLGEFSAKLSGVHPTLFHLKNKII